MSDALAARGEAIHKALLTMESECAENDLFPLGYMIPQVELVLENADYDPEDVVAEDFDATFEEWMQHAFAQDSMSVDDRERIAELWAEARKRAQTTVGA